ncbi:MAG: hypothetical protein ABIS03_06295, partial [Gemmatimonadaceae bacterium]
MNTHVSLRLGPLSFLALLAGLATVHADISDVSTGGTIEAEAQVSIRPAPDVPDPNPSRDDDAPPGEFDVTSYRKSASANAGKAGLRAKGRAQGQAQIRTTANSLTFSASATTEATATRTGDPLRDNNTGGGGSFSFSANFRVDSRSRFSLGGNVSVQTNGSNGSSEAQVVLEGRTDSGKDVKFDFDAEDEPGSRKTIGVSKSGFLEPGSYSISVFTLSTIGSTQPSSRTSLSASFSVSSPAPTPPPDEGQDIRWTDSGGGSFFDAANWTPPQVPVQTPGRSDRVTFNLNRSYDVDLAANPASVGTLLLTNGSRVSMGGGSLTVTGTSNDPPSFIVTKEAQLRLSGPATVLNTQYSLLGNHANRLGEVLVSGGARWNNRARLTVGERGEGSLIISNGGVVSTRDTFIGNGRQKGSVVVDGEGSLWDSGDVAVGFTSPGSLDIRTGGSVNSTNVGIGLIGPNSSGNAGVIVEGVSGDGTASTWLVTGTLAVGVRGLGLLGVADGAIVDCNELLVGTVGGGTGSAGVGGFRATGERATLRVRSGVIGNGDTGSLAVIQGGLAQFTGGPLVIGAGAFGTLRIFRDDQAEGSSPEVRFTDPTAVFSVGTGAGGIGSVTIDGGGLLTVTAPRMEIGATDFGVGEVTIQGEGRGVQSMLNVTGTLQIGGPTGGQGVLTLVDNRLSVTGELKILSNGILQGTGRVAASGGITCDGIISPGLSPGTLTIDANYEQTSSGTLKMEAAGLGAGQFDVLHLTGNATLGGTMEVTFLDGYLPKAGDALPFLQMDGGLSGDFAQITFPQLAPGFEFNAELVNGKYQLTALNDGVRRFAKGISQALLAGDPAGHEAAGLFTIRSSARGGFSARFIVGGRRFALKGKFDAAGRFTETIPRRGDSPLIVTFELSAADPRLVTGTITDGEHTIAISTDRANAFNAKANPAPQA